MSNKYCVSKPHSLEQSHTDIWQKIHQETFFPFFWRFASRDELIGHQFITNGMEKTSRLVFYSTTQTGIQQLFPKDTLILMQSL